MPLARALIVLKADSFRSALVKFSLPLFLPEFSRMSWVVSGSLFSLYFADHPPRGYRDLAGCRREWNSLLFHQLIERGYYLSHSLAMNAFSLAMKPGDVQGLVTAIDESLEALVPSTT